jgi:hypothetical protein
MGLAELLQAPEEVAVPESVGLLGLSSQHALPGLLEHHRTGLTRGLAHPVHGEVVEDAEQPGAGAAVIPSLLPVGDRPLQTVLDEIIGRRPVPGQGPRVAPQRGNLRLDQAEQVAHELDEACTCTGAPGRSAVPGTMTR